MLSRIISLIISYSICYSIIDGVARLLLTVLLRMQYKPISNLLP